MVRQVEKAKGAIKAEGTLMKTTQLNGYYWSIRFTTKIYTPAEMLGWLDAMNENGWVIFAPDEMQEVEIPQEDTDLGGKSPSQRQRAVLYRLWEKLGEKGDFEVFYRSQINRHIDLIKNKLD